MIKKHPIVLNENLANSPLFEVRLVAPNDFDQGIRKKGPGNWCLAETPEPLTLEDALQAVADVMAHEERLGCLGNGLGVTVRAVAPH